MDVAALRRTSPLGKPWRFSGTAMRPNTLLLCKLLFLLSAGHGVQRKFDDPYLPFVPIFDVLRDVPGLLPAALSTAYWVAGAALLMNAWVRASAVTLGTTIILALLASRPLFQNHVFIIGCLFLLSGLHRPGEAPWLIRWQFVLLYFGAALNKILQADWWSGAFMHTWMHDHLGNRLYALGSAVFPERWFAAGVSWAVMAAEFALVVLFLVRRWNHIAVWGVILLHLGFLAVVGLGPFGYFTEALMIGLLAFLSWPRHRVEVRFHQGRARWPRPWLVLANWDGLFRLGAPVTDGPWMEVRDGTRRTVNLEAALTVLLYTPAFYLALLGFSAVAVAMSASGCSMPSRPCYAGAACSSTSRSRCPISNCSSSTRAPAPRFNCCIGRPKLIPGFPLTTSCVYWRSGEPWRSRAACRCCSSVAERAGSRSPSPWCFTRSSD